MAVMAAIVETCHCRSERGLGFPKMVFWIWHSPVFSSEFLQYISSHLLKAEMSAPQHALRLVARGEQMDAPCEQPLLQPECPVMA